MTNSLLSTHLLLYIPVLKVTKWDQVFLLYFVKLVNSVTLFSYDTRAHRLKRMHRTKTYVVPFQQCCESTVCCWNKSYTYQSRNRKMQISVTLNKRLYWQLQGTYIDEEEWIPWHSRCQPPYGINEVNHTLKSIKQYVPNIFLLTWTCLIKKRKNPHSVRRWINCLLFNSAP